MGKEIVYCSGCGKSLREEDFQKRRAQLVDHLAYCADCRPLPTAPERPPTPSSTRRIPHASAPRTARHQASGSAPKALLVGVPVGVGLLLVVAIAVTSAPARPKEEPPPPPPPTPVRRAPDPKPAAAAPRPPTAPSKIPARPKTPEEVLRDLEALAASGADPAAVLLACDEARSALKGTPHEAALRRLEDAARARSEAARLDSFLAQIRSVIAQDTDGGRRDEIRRMFDTALGMAGPRKPEVEKMRADWEATANPAAPMPKTVFKQDFADGRGRFQEGETVPDGGIGGSPALSMGPAGVIAWQAFDTTVRETTTVRLKLKASAPITRVQIMAWSEKRQENGRFYVDRLEPGDWKAVEFKALQFRMGARNASPPMAVGDDFRSLKIFFEGPADAKLLIDDVEILE